MAIANRKLPDLTPQLVNKFWQRVNKQSPDECWNWTGATRRDGYGQISIPQPPQNAIFLRANRLSYFINFGVDPCDLEVCHKCDNPSCVNPEHLFLGTQNENVQDCINKNRKARGEKNGISKLCEREVTEIRKRFSEGERISNLAREYDVTYSQIWNITKNKQWKK